MKLVKSFNSLVARFKPTPVSGDGRDTRMLTLMLMCFMVIMPEFVMAEPWDDIADKIVSVLTGGFARTCAIIAVAACGYRWWVGKMTMEVAGGVIGGIIVVFGAASIVDFVAG